MSQSDHGRASAFVAAPEPPTPRPRPSGAARWPEPPIVALCRPRDDIDNDEVRQAQRLCPTLVETFPSTPLSVRNGLMTLCRTMRSLSLDETDCMTLEIVLAEALNNIVEHAYRDDDHGWILVEVDYLRGWVAVRVTDGGLPMPDGALPQPPQRDLGAAAGLCVSDLPEGGFGWSMIHELTSHLTYRRLKARNCLSFALPLATPN